MKKDKELSDQLLRGKENRRGDGKNTEYCRVLYFNNCWFTNVGEAFIDIGAMELIRRIFDAPKIICVSDMNRLYTELVSKREKIQNPYLQNKNLFNMFISYPADYFVLAGMFACEQFINAQCSREIMQLSQKGVKIIFLGLGQAFYTVEETDKFRKYIEQLRPACIMTRDDYVYDNLSGACPVVKGLDCAFWAKDCYDPRLSGMSTYDVVTYNRSPEPKEFRGRNDVVRAYHMQWQFSSKYFVHNLMVSDTPYDYLTLYANANAVYTDLVHGTIPALQYERPVRFERVDNRGYAIDAVESIRYGADQSIWVREADLELQKKRIEKELADQINPGRQGGVRR